MNSLFRFWILLIIIGIYSVGTAQDTHLKLRSEQISIQKDSTFIRKITISFEENVAPRVYPIFYDTELERLSDIELFEQKGKRLKKLYLETIDEEVNLDYITSKKIKSVVIPAEKKVQLTYLVTCNELMYLSSLPLFSYNQIDTLEYQIKVPNEFGITHNTIYKDSLSFYSIDSTKTENDVLLKLKVAPKKVKPDPLQFFGIYKNMKVPLMRTLIIPNSYEGLPAKYMNDWYIRSVLPQGGLNTTVKDKLDALTLNVTNASEIVNIIYDYVRHNFKYVAIEIGMGAFIPSHVNSVYLNKQGDCKDLSNFLSEALRYKGIECDLALAATFDHISDCDFPSLSSANHVVCVAYINGEKVLLDPTDPIHLQGTPVQSLQDRTILIVNSEGGSFYKVNRFEPEQNVINYQLDLKINSDNDIVEGAFQIDYKGISSNYLRRILDIEGQKDFNVFSNTFFEEVLGNQQILNIEYTDSSEVLNFKGDIAIRGKTFSDEANRYLFIDFLPRLIDPESRETLIEGTYIGNTFKKILTAKISLNEPIETFETIEHYHEGDGVSLRVMISSISDWEIECRYNFVFDHILTEKENIKAINKILNSFKNIINEPIVLKKHNG